MSDNISKKILHQRSILLSTTTPSSDKLLGDTSKKVRSNFTASIGKKKTTNQINNVAATPQTRSSITRPTPVDDNLIHLQQPQQQYQVQQQTLQLH